MSQSVLEKEATGIARFRQSTVIRGINLFMESPWFVALVCVLLLISNLFGAELIVYPVLLLFGICMANGRWANGLGWPHLVSGRY